MPRRSPAQPVRPYSQHVALLLDAFDELGVLYGLPPASWSNNDDNDTMCSDYRVWCHEEREKSS